MCVSVVLFRNRKVRTTPAKFFFLFNYPRFGKWRKKNYLNEKKEREIVRFVPNSKNLLFFEVIVQSFQQMAHSWQRSILFLSRRGKKKSLNSSINYCQNGKVVLISRVVVTSGNKSGKTPITSRKKMNGTNEFKVESKKMKKKKKLVTKTRLSLDFFRFDCIRLNGCVLVLLFFFSLSSNFSQCPMLIVTLSSCNSFNSRCHCGTNTLKKNSI